MLIDYGYLVYSPWLQMLSQSKKYLKSVWLPKVFFLKNHFSVRQNSSLEDCVDSLIMLDNTD